jgi:hypothetical protein
VPHSTEPPPRLILVVPGRWEQFWQWADTRREEGRLQIRSTNRAAGSFVTLEGTRYQCVTRFEQRVQSGYASHQGRHVVEP